MRDLRLARSRGDRLGVIHAGDTAARLHADVTRAEVELIASTCRR
jgi:hypothetical protein